MDHVKEGKGLGPGRKRISKGSGDHLESPPPSDHAEEGLPHWLWTSVGSRLRGRWELIASHTRANLGVVLMGFGGGKGPQVGTDFGVYVRHAEQGAASKRGRGQEELPKYISYR